MALKGSRRGLEGWGRGRGVRDWEMDWGDSRDWDEGWSGAELGNWE